MTLHRRRKTECAVLWVALRCCFSSSRWSWPMLIGEPRQQAKAAHDWVATPCVVTSSEVRTTRSGRTMTYPIDVRYTYVWNGQTFNGKRYSFALGSNVGVGAMQKVVNSLPPRANTICYVNPAQPAESVINRDTTSGLWVRWLSLGAVVIFFGMMYGMWRLKARTA